MGIIEKTMKLSFCGQATSETKLWRRYSGIVVEVMSELNTNFFPSRTLLQTGSMDIV